MQGQRTLADAILILPPYYHAGVPEQGIAAFLQQILEASPLPVYFYKYAAC